MELRPLTDDILPLARLLYLDAVAEFKPFLTCQDQQLTAFDATALRPNNLYEVAVQDGQVVALVGLEDIRWTDRAATLMLSVVPASRGQGLGTQVLDMWIKKAFTDWNLRRLIGISLEGSATEKICTTLGFSLEGLLQRDRWKDGAYRNVSILALEAPASKE